MQKFKIFVEECLERVPFTLDFFAGSFQKWCLVYISEYWTTKSHFVISHPNTDSSYCCEIHFRNWFHFDETTLFAAVIVIDLQELVELIQPDILPIISKGSGKNSNLENKQ